MHLLLSAIPWVLTILPLPVIGRTLFAVLASLVWIGFIWAWRTIGRSLSRREKLQLDAMLVVGCLVIWFYGGLYWLPAALAFLAVDYATATDARRPSPHEA